MERTPPLRRRPSTRAQRSAIFRQAAAIVRAEFARPITFDDVARRVAVSPRQLRRAFSEAGGITFRSYLAKVRMDHAAELLTATDTPLESVGRRVGYDHPSQFTKAFKRVYGVTPSEFRAMHGPPSGDWPRLS